MNLLGKVERLHYRDGQSLPEIEPLTGLRRKTIRKWLNAAESIQPKCRRRGGDPKIKSNAEKLVKMLGTDVRLPPRELRTALKLLRQSDGRDPMEALIYSEPVKY